MEEKKKVLIALMGKSCSGKDTVMRKLREAGVARIVTNTTRPMRPGEKDGEEYYFKSEADYKKAYYEDRILDSREYDTVHGLWRYWTEAFTLDAPYTVIVTTPESECLLDVYMFSLDNPKFVPVYLEVPEDVRLQRALERENKKPKPDYDEMYRRIEADNKDFSEKALSGIRNLVRFKNETEEDLDRFLKFIFEQ